MSKADQTDTAKAAAAHAECAKPRVRDRIFETACDLFYRQGIRCVGVDTIASEAGTNKMSFYRNFPSKDDLVCAYLKKEADEFHKWWDGVVAPHAGNPRRQIEALFEAHVAKILEQECHGCAFMNAAVELRDTDREAMRIIQQSKAETRRRFRRLAREAGARTPDLLGDALVLIAAGSLMTRLTFAADEWPGAQASKIVKKLLAAHID